jgi:hypothetical protein
VKSKFAKSHGTATILNDDEMGKAPGTGTSAQTLTFRRLFPSRARRGFSSGRPPLRCRVSSFAPGGARSPASPLSRGVRPRLTASLPLRRRGPRLEALSLAVVPRARRRGEQLAIASIGLSLPGGWRCAERLSQPLPSPGVLRASRVGAQNASYVPRVLFVKAAPRSRFPLREHAEKQRRDSRSRERTYCRPPRVQ